MNRQICDIVERAFGWYKYMHRQLAGFMLRDELLGFHPNALSREKRRDRFNFHLVSYASHHLIFCMAIDIKNV